MTSPRYEVRRGDELALVVVDEPGALISKTSPPPPPGVPVTTHPFLSASAHLPEVEGELRRLLDGSDSTAEYLDRLRGAGYTVVPVS